MRQELGTDARPVVFDEAESENQHTANRLQGVLELARQASSEGAPILKGTISGRAMSFRVRSTFMFSSIGTSINLQSDASRITMLDLVPGSLDKFAGIEALAAEICTEATCKALRSRTLGMIPIIRSNFKIFAQAASEILGNRRLGDQSGALLAGAYSLRSKTVATIEEAREWMKQHDWDHARLHNDQKDEWRCFKYIMEFKAKVQGHNCTYDIPVGELIQIVLGHEVAQEHISTDSAHDTLQRIGIKCHAADNMFMVANNHRAIESMLNGTPWHKNWRHSLARLPGCVAESTQRFKGTTSRVVIIPGGIL